MKTDERNERVKEASKIKRKLEETSDRLDHAKRENDTLKEDIQSLKREQSSLKKVKDDLEAKLRKLRYKSFSSYNMSLQNASKYLQLTTVLT